MQFIGEAGAHYNILSELSHQVTMKLKTGVMWDHNGTYIDGLGIRYKDFEVVCELDGNNLQGKWPCVHPPDTDVVHACQCSLAGP